MIRRDATAGKPLLAERVWHRDGRKDVTGWSSESRYVSIEPICRRRDGKVSAEFRKDMLGFGAYTALFMRLANA